MGLHECKVAKIVGAKVFFLLEIYRAGMERDRLIVAQRAKQPRSLIKDKGLGIQSRRQSSLHENVLFRIPIEMLRNLHEFRLTAARAIPEDLI